PLHTTPHPPRPPLFPYTTLFRSSQTSIFHPRRRKRSAATRASPALLPFPANTMHLPGLGKNFVTVCATPAPASSMSASTCTPLADRKSTRLNSSHLGISYAVFCL